MRKNFSPWLHQLDTGRRSVRLVHDVATDVAIVGAGIAGVATAFFTLKYTDKRVVVLERHKLAHGATGHNAGQVVSYFERGFAAIAEEFGPQLAAAGQKAIEDTWELLDEMYTGAGLTIPFSRFIGHGGLTSREQVLWHLRNNLAKRAAGLRSPRLKIAAESGLAPSIPAEYRDLYDVVPHADVLTTLETTVKDYIALVSTHKGCINSALFCQEVVRYLQETYGERFALYEQTPVHKVLLRDDHAIIDADRAVVSVDRVVLCTNGFENLHIINDGGLEIDAKYHHLVSGKIGYMSGYLERMNKLPIAISYYSDPKTGTDNSYFYLTRRPFEHGDARHNLISIGGPDIDIDERAPYSYQDSFPDEMAQEIDAFVHRVYDLEPNRRIDYIYTWHGLMGYTANGIRLVGPEPQNKTLLYNLGCNGIGILPSVYGGRTIARHIAGERVPRSIFDVPRRIPMAPPLDLPRETQQIS